MNHCLVGRGGDHCAIDLFQIRNSVHGELLLIPASGCLWSLLLCLSLGDVARHRLGRLWSDLLDLFLLFFIGNLLLWSDEAFSELRSGSSWLFYSCKAEIVIINVVTLSGLLLLFEFD